MLKRPLAIMICLTLVAMLGSNAQPARANVPIAPSSTITVNTLNDELNNDGDCSLREAITAANTNVAVDACAAGVQGADTITFNVTGTITLTSSLPGIADALTIAGPSAANLTISGNSAVTVLTVNAGKTLTLRNVTIANSSYSGLTNHGTLIVANSIIANNRGYDGAGILNAGGGTVDLADSTLSGNIADGYGGGIFNAGVFTITRSSLSGNRSQHSWLTFGGGGITNWYGGTLRVIASTLSGNVADCYGCPGGGIYVAGGVVTILNSTLSGNVARYGGGILNQSPSGNVTIINSTLYDNQAQYAGSSLLGYGGIFRLYDSVIAIPAAGWNCYSYSGFVDGGHNLQFPDASCGSTIPVANPQLGPLQNNGGSTFTHALLADSPAIDAVPLAACSFATTDQRGFPRPQGPACDIGAFELVQNQPPTVDAGGPSDVDEGGSITVTATGSDPEGQVLTYAWDLDNNGTFETPGQSAIFSAAGLDGPITRTIAVQVTDASGLTATDQATVNVLNVAPTVNAGPDAILIRGHAFTTIGSFSDPGPDTWTATVDYGDGSGVQLLALTAKTFTLNHLYAAKGVYTVTVSVADDDGGEGVDTLVVTVRSPQDATGDLIQQIHDLVNRGVLNGGQGNSLIAKLEGVLKQLEKDNTKTAMNELQAFINQVNSFMNSTPPILTPEEGQPLIDAANAIIAALAGRSQ